MDIEPASVLQTGNPLTLRGRITYNASFRMMFCRSEPPYDEIGHLDWSDGVLHFVGQADEAARVLFEVLRPYVDGYIQAELERCRA